MNVFLTCKFLIKKKEKRKKERKEKNQKKRKKEKDYIIVYTTYILYIIKKEKRNNPKPQKFWFKNMHIFAPTVFNYSSTQVAIPV